MKKLLPKMYKENIYKINYKYLKEYGIRCLFFDMDNTLIDNKTTTPSQEVIDLMKRLKKEHFKIIIISNALPNRLKKVVKQIEIDDSISFACKPLKKNYLKLMKKYKLNNHEIACIGDQIFTDIKGANNLNIFSILVDPISKHEHIITKINRIKERKIFNKYIRRGEYYG